MQSSLELTEKENIYVHFITRGDDKLCLVSFWMETQNLTAQCYNWLQCHVQGERMRHCETKYRKGVKQGWYSIAKKVSLLEFSNCFVYSPPAGIYMQKRQGVGMCCRWAYITVSFTYLSSILLDTRDSNLNRECTLRTSVLFMIL